MVGQRYRNRSIHRYCWWFGKSCVERLSYHPQRLHPECQSPTNSGPQEKVVCHYSNCPWESQTCGNHLGSIHNKEPSATGTTGCPGAISRTTEVNTRHDLPTEAAPPFSFLEATREVAVQRTTESSFFYFTRYHTRTVCTTLSAQATRPKRPFSFLKKRTGTIPYNVVCMVALAFDVCMHANICMATSDFVLRILPRARTIVPWYLVLLYPCNL